MQWHPRGGVKVNGCGRTSSAGERWPGMGKHKKDRNGDKEMIVEGELGQIRLRGNRTGTPPSTTLETRP